jgi:ABC-type nitrate/sulfonate/bicarbonate transport system substrate-binding protein
MPQFLKEAENPMTEALTDLKILAFPGAPNLPLFAALDRGFFEAAGLKVDLATTPSSIYQFEQFAVGGCDIAFTAFDNIVAYREGQGAAKLVDPPDFRVILGATQIELSVVVAPDVKSAADLRGKSIALDAVSTGFAFVLYAMLEKLGLADGEYERVAVGSTPDRWQSVKAGTHAGTITIEPFTSIARAAGFHVLGQSTDFFPSYQGGIVAASEDWIAAHPGLVRAFIDAYRKGLAWTLDPANREAATSLLLARMPDIKPAVADAVMRSVLSPRSGLTPGGVVLPDGMRAVLDLRSRYGRPQRNLSDVDKYLSLSYNHTM